MMRVNDIREKFLELKNSNERVVDKTGCSMLELLGATFLADEEAIFGEVNHDYVKREIEWYESESLNVNDIPGGAPTQWKKCASSDGIINSNYGYLIWNPDNHLQYNHVLNELKSNPFSRRAVMIYTRPKIWYEYDQDGMSDFICTNATQHFIRNEKLVTVVQMRSNDVVWGYKNDYAWQKYVHAKLASNLSIDEGDIIWHVGSLHVYERHFNLVK